MQNHKTQKVKERGICFKAPMVRAILEGRKTQARIIVDPQPDPSVAHCGTLFSKQGYEYHWLEGDGTLDGDEFVGDWFSCPWGQPGERLWVRETHGLHDVNLHGYPQCLIRYNADNSILIVDPADDDFPRPLADDEKDAVFNHKRSRPSIHMPRWASRLTLELTGVRVERLQEISEEDAKAEAALYALDQEQTVLSPHLTEELNIGCAACKGDVSGIAELCHPSLRGKGRPHACWFAPLWESINGTGSWNANPWVWVLEFTRVQP